MQRDRIVGGSILVILLVVLGLLWWWFIGMGEPARLPPGGPPESNEELATDVQTGRVNLEVPGADADSPAEPTIVDSPTPAVPQTADAEPQSNVEAIAELLAYYDAVMWASFSSPQATAGLPSPPSFALDLASFADELFAATAPDIWVPVSRSRTTPQSRGRRSPQPDELGNFELCVITHLSQLIRTVPQAEETHAQLLPIFFEHLSEVSSERVFEPLTDWLTIRLAYYHPVEELMARVRDELLQCDRVALLQPRFVDEGDLLLSWLEGRMAILYTLLRRTCSLYQVSEDWRPLLTMELLPWHYPGVTTCVQLLDDPGCIPELLSLRDREMASDYVDVYPEHHALFEFACHTALARCGYREDRPSVLEEIMALFADPPAGLPMSQIQARAAETLIRQAVNLDDAVTSLLDLDELLDERYPELPEFNWGGRVSEEWITEANLEESLRMLMRRYAEQDRLAAKVNCLRVIVWTVSKFADVTPNRESLATIFLGTVWSDFPQVLDQPSSALYHYWIHGALPALVLLSPESGWRELAVALDTMAAREALTQSQLNSFVLTVVGLGGNWQRFDANDPRLQHVDAFLEHLIRSPLAWHLRGPSERQFFQFLQTRPMPWLRPDIELIMQRIQQERELGNAGPFLITGWWEDVLEAWDRAAESSDD